MLKSFVIGLTLFISGTANLYAGDLPDPKLTPGDTINVNKKFLCQAHYTACVRHVTNPAAIYKAYGIKSHKPREYEIDHLISLELGGSNNPENLWPQSYVTEPLNAHVKDLLENKLNDMVCKDQISLEKAQELISKDWVTAFNRYGGTGAPRGRPRISQKDCKMLHDKFVVSK